MSLRDRLDQANLVAAHVPASESQPMGPAPRADPVAELRRRAQELLFSRIGNRLSDASLSQEQLRGMVVVTFSAAGSSTPSINAGPANTVSRVT